MRDRNNLLIRVVFVLVLSAILFSLQRAPGLLKRRTAQKKSTLNIQGKVTAQTIRTILKDIKDPEIGINIVDLGLVKDITLDGSDVSVTLVLTSPFCPYVDILIYEIKRQIKRMEGVNGIDVNIDLDTAWHPDMMTEEGKRQLERFAHAS